MRASLYRGDVSENIFNNEWHHFSIYCKYEEQVLIYDMMVNSWEKQRF